MTLYNDLDFRHVVGMNHWNLNVTHSKLPWALHPSLLERHAKPVKQVDHIEDSIPTFIRERKTSRVVTAPYSRIFEYQSQTKWCVWLKPKTCKDRWRRQENEGQIESLSKKKKAVIAVMVRDSIVLPTMQYIARMMNGEYAFPESYKIPLTSSARGSIPTLRPPDRYRSWTSNQRKVLSVK